MSHEPTPSTKQIVRQLTKLSDSDLAWTIARLTKTMGERNGGSTKRGASVPKLPVMQPGV